GPFGGGARVLASAGLGAGGEPMPTPTSGWFRITVAVISTSRERPLVAWRSECWCATVPANAPATIRAAAAPTRITRRLLRSARTALATKVTTKSTAMLDCEYEK